MWLERARFELVRRIGASCLRLTMVDVVLLVLSGGFCCRFWMLIGRCVNLVVNRERPSVLVERCLYYGFGDCARSQNYLIKAFLELERWHLETSMSSKSRRTDGVSLADLPADLWDPPGV